MKSYKLSFSMLFGLLVILILYVVVLDQHFLIEEILFLFLFPILGSMIFGAIFSIRKLLQRKVSLWELLIKDLRNIEIIQIVILAVVLFLSYPRYFNKDEVNKDLDHMVERLEDIHPDLYDFVTREEIYDEINKLKERIPEKISDLELYKELTKLMAMFRDGHTKAGENFYQKRMHILFLKLFPYKIKIQNNRIFVYGNHSYKNKIPIGAEILEINGRKPQNFIREINQLWSYDNTNNKVQLANPVLIGLWNNFNDFTLTYKSPESDKIKTIASSGGLISNLSIIQELLKGHKEPYYEFIGLHKT